MNREGLEPTERLDYIWTTHIAPQMDLLREALNRLIANGTLRPVSVRMLFFLMAHGAAAPYTLTALSSKFDRRDGELDEDHHAELAADVIITGMLA